MNQLSKLWISISIALGIAQISQASILPKTLITGLMHDSSIS